MTVCCAIVRRNVDCCHGHYIDSNNFQPPAVSGGSTPQVLAFMAINKTHHQFVCNRNDIIDILNRFQFKRNATAHLLIAAEPPLILLACSTDEKNCNKYDRPPGRRALRQSRSTVTLAAAATWSTGESRGPHWQLVVRPGQGPQPPPEPHEPVLSTT